MNPQNNQKNTEDKGLLVDNQKPLGTGEEKLGTFEGINIRELEGMFEVVTSIPTRTPKGDFYSFFKIYYDSLTSPTVRRIYMFVPVVEEWTYINLTV